jgi:hypothetical protein
MRFVLAGVLFASTAQAQQAIGSVEAQNVTVRGAVTLTGNTAELHSGAQILTSDKPSEVKLARGGVLRICPRSSVQITASPGGKQLLIALDAGSIETDYPIPSGADAVMTPDFQLQLTGPGHFHYAVGMQSTQMCTRALAGANASVIVSETLGTGTYQLRPGDRATFNNGTVANPDTQTGLDCGCPLPAVQTAPAPPELGFPEQQSQAAAQAIQTGNTPPAAPPITGVPESAKADQPATQVSVPLAFSAGEPAPPPAPTPVTDAQLATLPQLAQPVVQPPPKPKRNFFQSLGHALSRLFGKKG